MSIRTKPHAQASGRKVTPPSPSYMDNNQFSSYLADLRTNRIARPGGARPLPGANAAGAAKPSFESSRSSTHSSSTFGFNRRESGRIASNTARNSLPDANTATADHHTHQSGSGGSRAPAVVIHQTTPAGTGSILPSHASSVSGSIASRASRYSTVIGRGRDYYPASQKTVASSTAATTKDMPPPPLRPGEVVPTDTYMENGQRWMEKEEAVSLRHALEDMDLKTRAKDGTTFTNSRSHARDASLSNADDAEQRLYNAALTEAADLVWQHQHGIKPPEPDAPYRYRQHLRKNSYAHARTASVGRYGNDIEPTGLARDPAIRSSSGSSSSSASSFGSGFAASQRSRYSYTGSTRVVSGGIGSHSSNRGSTDNSARPSLDQADDANDALPSGTATAGGAARRPLKSYNGIVAAGPRPMPGAASAVSQPAGTRRRSSMKRNISGEIEKPFSGDQIYEEPETATPETKSATGQSAIHAKAGNRGAVLQIKGSAANVSNESEPRNNANKSADHSVSKLVSRYEIHRNPPTQSLNPHYTTNTAQPHNFLQQEEQQQQKDTQGTTTSSAMPAPLQVPRKNGVEIRSDDIRQATSMKLKDRSPKLPTPSYVSDNPGRPIVSFDGNWKAPRDEAATDAKADAQKRSSLGRGGDGGRRGGIAADIDSNRGSAQTNSNAQGGQGEPKKETSALPPAPTGPISSSAGFHASPAIPPQQHEQLRRQEEPQTHRPFQQQPPTVSVSSWESQGPSSGDSQMPPLPTIAVTDESEQTRPAPMVVPTISVTADSSESSKSSSQPAVPTIVLPGDNEDNGDVASNIPVIVTPDDGPAPATPAKASARPLPTPVRGAAGSNVGWPRGHWSRAPAHYPPSSASSATGSIAGSRATARCHACREPIEGRFVALAGVPGLRNAQGASNAGSGSERFHPECFRCYACGTTLEAMEISPEPDAARSARLHRIERRARGEVLDEQPGETMAEDGDDRLRFYCHLDWHELFAPRCKHCKTPIMGEHVVALGAHWHVGHFFCAECGDPFGPGATHIEKDGYAWCVGCQARRTERRAPKCRACGSAVIGQYVQALGAEWHDACFRCGVCGGGFADGQVFPREGAVGLMQVVCTECRQRELKA